MPRSGRRGTRVVALCRMPRAPMRAAVVLLCLAMVLLPPAVVRGDACEEDMLRQTVYTNITSLPRLHPARVVLKNLVVGRCSLEQYQREKKAVLDLIAATQATIFLLTETGCFRQHDLTGGRSRRGGRRGVHRRGRECRLRGGAGR